MTLTFDRLLKLVGTLLRKIDILTTVNCEVQATIPISFYRALVLCKTRDLDRNLTLIVQCVRGTSWVHAVTRYRQFEHGMTVVRSWCRISCKGFSPYTVIPGAAYHTIHNLSTTTNSKFQSIQCHFVLLSDLSALAPLQGQYKPHTGHTGRTVHTGHAPAV